MCSSQLSLTRAPRVKPLLPHLLTLYFWSCPNFLFGEVGIITTLSARNYDKDYEIICIKFLEEKVKKCPPLLFPFRFTSGSSLEPLPAAVWVKRLVLKHVHMPRHLGLNDSVTDEPHARVTLGSGGEWNSNLGCHLVPPFGNASHTGNSRDDCWRLDGVGGR